MRCVFSVCLPPGLISLQLELQNPTYLEKCREKKKNLRKQITCIVKGFGFILDGSFLHPMGDIRKKAHPEGVKNSIFVMKTRG